MGQLNEQIIIEGMDHFGYLEEKRLPTEYEYILAKEEIHWRQKSREVWLVRGTITPNYFMMSQNSGDTSIVTSKFQKMIGVLLRIQRLSQEVWLHTFKIFLMIMRDHI